MNQEQNINDKIYKTASKRVGFKIHLTIFVLVNLFLWVIWFFTFRKHEELNPVMLNAFLFISIAWLIAVVAHYMIVYKWNKSLIDKEVEKMKRTETKEDVFPTVQ